MKVYYAHPVSTYNSLQELRDIEILERLNLEVVNPNNPVDALGYEKEGMAYFKRVVESCDLLAFKAFPDGSIPKGVSTEISWAEVVIELPVHLARRTLSVEETREYLLNTGCR